MKQQFTINPHKIYITNIAGKIGCTNDLESDLDVTFKNTEIKLEIEIEDLTLNVKIDKALLSVVLSVYDEEVDKPNRLWLENNFFLHHTNKQYYKTFNFVLIDVEIEWNAPLQLFNPGAQEVPEYDWVLDFDLVENKCTISKR